MSNPDLEMESPVTFVIRLTLYPLLLGVNVQQRCIVCESACAMCRRSKSATSLGDTPLESLPLLHQAPTPEPEPAQHQNRDSSKDSHSNKSIAPASKQDDDSATDASATALEVHADNVATDTPGIQAPAVAPVCNDSLDISHPVHPVSLLSSNRSTNCDVCCACSTSNSPS